MVERSVWDREVPGSSPGAPIFLWLYFMPIKIFDQAAILPSYNLFLERTDFNCIKVGSDVSVLISRIIRTPFNFASLVPSIAVNLPKDSAVLLHISIKTNKGWSKFYKLFYLSQNYKKTFTNNKDIYSKIDIDTINAIGGGSAFKLQITLIGKAKVNLITIALTNREIKPNMELALESLETNGIKETILDVPQISQKKFTNKSLRNRICSPTCLTMALKYFGKNITLRDTLQGVYDNNSNTYGVWPLNTAYASELGVNCCFVRVASLAQAEAEILQKRPLIISISFKKGELKNSPLIETKGHLIVLVGITPKGDFYVLDPASNTDKEVLRIYSRKDLAKVWIKNKNGATYAFR